MRSFALASYFFALYSKLGEEGWHIVTRTSNHEISFSHSLSAPLVVRIVSYGSRSTDIGLRISYI